MPAAMSRLPLVCRAAADQVAAVALSPAIPLPSVSASQLQHVDGEDADRRLQVEWLPEEEVAEMKRQLAEEEGIEWDEVEEATVVDTDGVQGDGYDEPHRTTPSSSSSSSSSPQ